MQRWIDKASEPEEPDQTPVEMPVIAPESTSEQIARLIAEHVQREAIAQGFGSWEDEEDFEDEDPNLLNFSPYELTELQSDAELPSPDDEPPPKPPEPPEPQEPPEPPEGDPERSA